MTPPADRDDLAAARARRAALARDQNDAFRRAAGRGLAGSPLAGRVVLDPSVTALGVAFVQAALVAVADADPSQQDDHERGTAAVPGPDGRVVAVAWAIEVHARSPDDVARTTHDPKRTARTLTVRLAGRN